MIRYHLDDLGWFHFEALVQALLKAKLGLTIESWGGHSDRGRDAYALGPLGFPEPNKPTLGPFIFQAKFVQGANAAGAKPAKLLLKAIAAEVSEIEERIRKGYWTEPKCYVLVTNAPLHSSTRDAIKESLATVLPSATIVSLGGNDICDLLDTSPFLRSSFPEIMSLRDLETLLHEAVNKSVLERSRSAIEEAKDIVPIFVPTKAYEKAWSILQAHNFVVLDGPPEMGKTAIARMIALAQITHGWQAIECRGPDDLFSNYLMEASQIFIADDAFGRTEYDVSLGRLWERDLPRVLNRVGSKHWLIWTSRKHILIRALKEMDLTGRAEKFPNPGEVVVTADDLSVEEKARILYRHARAANLEESLKKIVRGNAVLIVNDNHFTPERIRRFIKDRLMVFADDSQATSFTEGQIAEEVIEAIRNPTDRMQKAFGRLPSIHKWILLSLLECGYLGKIKELQVLFSKHHSNVSQALFTEALEDLDGTFVKLKTVVILHEEYESVDWIHPSYRDLVIDEMAKDLSTQIKFLEKASFDGIKLALSEAGGRVGARNLPLLNHEECWQALRIRSQEIAESEAGAFQILRLLVDALSIQDIDGAATEHILEIIRGCCNIAYKEWETKGNKVSLIFLSTYLSAARKLDPPPPFPNLVGLWEEASLNIQEYLDDGTYVIPSEDIELWSLLLKLIEEFNKSVFGRPQFQEDFQNAFERIFDYLETYLSDEIQGLSSDEYDQEAEWLDEIWSSLTDVPVPMKSKTAVNNLLSELNYRSDIYRGYASADDQETDYDFEARATVRDFNVNDLFSDL